MPPGGRPRNSETMFPKPFQTSFHQLRLSALYLLGTLLFIVFWLSSFRLTGYQFKRERRKSQQENLHRKSDICGRFLCGCTRETKICRIREFFKRMGGIGLQPLGKTAIMLFDNWFRWRRGVERKRKSQFGRPLAAGPAVRRPDRGRRHPAGGFRRGAGGGVRHLPSLYGGADPSPGGHPQILAVVSAHRLGCAIGFLGFAKGIAAAIDVSSTVTTWLFIG